MNFFRKRNKFNAVKSFCNNKLHKKHDSKGEAICCNMLHKELLSGKFQSIEIQKNFPIVINKKLICNHRVDFLITELDGQLKVVEFKGFATSEWKIKKKLFETFYPHIKYEVIKK